jgi:hypothetical protein
MASRYCEYGEPVSEVGNERLCVVAGCHLPASGSPAPVGGASAHVCSRHRRAIAAEPLAWDGELNVTATEVLRLWRREGIDAG